VNLRIVDDNVKNLPANSAGEIIVQRPNVFSGYWRKDPATYAWDKFYEEEPQTYKMFKLLKNVMEKEKLDGTFKQRVRQ
jgi:acyl-CoA synthetase (AMP-forming)/AMP-acid ligase II